MYFDKLRRRIIDYLDIGAVLNLSMANKFYRYTLKKELGGKMKEYFKGMYERRVDGEMRSAKLYERIYELFPLENIKINAFKYLHFRIRPATYILPFLQEEQVEIQKKEVEEEKDKQLGKFNWKFWGSDKKI